MLYNSIIILGTLCQLPKWLLRKKYRGSLLQRLGLRLPPKANTVPTIWIHAVSLGETKAAFPIYQRLKKEYPTAAFYFSTLTKTGLNQAKTLYPDAHHFYLPVDLSWTMRRLAERLKPDFLYLSEGDFWLNLMKSVKNRGGKIYLLSGKLSKRSQNRLSKAPRFSKSLFDKIDHFCVQTPEFERRFRSLYILPDRITVTGNLKLSFAPTKLTPEQKSELQTKYGLKKGETVITIGSTHKGEEDLLLKYLPNVQILLAPRHPERFKEVKKLLTKYPHVRLIEEMGQLYSCFQLSDLAIIGGSFLPHVGGHNIFEPIQAGIPVLFGPHMENQKELVQTVLDGKAGIQTPAEKLPDVLDEALALRPNAQRLSVYGEEIVEGTWKALS